MGCNKKMIVKEVGSQKINNDWVHADTPAHPWKYIFFVEHAQPTKNLFAKSKTWFTNLSHTPDRHFQAQSIESKIMVNIKHYF